MLAQRVPAARESVAHVYTAKVGRKESVCVSIDSYSWGSLLSFQRYVFLKCRSVFVFSNLLLVMHFLIPNDSPF